jgi:hypothetical protein
MAFNFQTLADAWPAPIVARGQIERFSGGLLTSKSMANLDSLGLGPPRGRLGRKVFYDVVELCRWMQQRAEDRI